MLCLTVHTLLDKSLNRMMLLSIILISNYVHYEARVNNTVNNKESSVNPVWLKNKFLYVQER